mmetsp:Transcript_25280/g.44937  ORF Transcript_25280/g.44937 Transcript_25280/m.44937 type:complete len:207 (-) Transcript_25280:236-856(-)
MDMVKAVSSASLSSCEFQPTPSPNDVFEVFSNHEIASIRSIANPTISRPLPRSGPLTIHSWRCTSATDMDASWEVNMANVNSAGIQWLGNGYCYTFANSSFNNAVQMYQYTINDMSAFFKVGYRPFNGGHADDPTCTGNYTFGGGEYGIMNAEVFWAMKGTTEISNSSRKVYQFGCLFKKIGCPRGYCSLSDEDLVRTADLSSCEI